MKKQWTVPLYILCAAADKSSGSYWQGVGFGV